MCLTRYRLAVLAGIVLLTLALAACTATDDATESSPGVEEDAAEPGSPLEPESAALADDLAARVNGTDISREQVEQRVEAAVQAAGDDMLAELEEGQTEVLLSQLRTEILNETIQGEIVLSTAAELDAEPTEEQVASARAALVDSMGGEEAFIEVTELAGLSGEALEQQLRAAAAIDTIADALVQRGDLDGTEAPADGAPDELTSQDLALQEFFGERLALADVTVHPDYGVWNPEFGQVVPPDAQLPADP